MKLLTKTVQKLVTATANVQEATGVEFSIQEAKMLIALWGNTRTADIINKLADINIHVKDADIMALWDRWLEIQRELDKL